MSFSYQLFDTLLEPVFILNGEQKVVYCNETASVLCDLSIRKITRGMTFTSLFQFSEPFDAVQNLVQIADPTPYKELNFTTSTGNEGKAQITLQPVTSPEGESHWIVFMRDVTLEERLQKKYRAELEQKEDVIKALEDAKAKLEDYSQNLEKMVAERTAQLSRLNQMMSALLDSLGQGFFVFDKDGLCLEVNSKACSDTVECMPAGKNIWDVLALPANKHDGFKKWMMTLFMEMLPFEDLAPLGPPTFPHSQGKHIKLEYFPLNSAEGKIEGVVVVASDITSLIEAQQQAEREKENAKLIIHLVKSKREVARFIRDSEQMLRDLKTELHRDTRDTDTIYRYLHTLKGGAASFSIQQMTELCHQAETQVNSFLQDKKSENFQPLFDFYTKIDGSFRHFLSESQDILGKSALSTDRSIEIPFSKLSHLIEDVRGYSAPAAAAVAEALLMEPVQSFFQAYDDLSRRVAEKEGKSLLPVEFSGGDIKVLPEVYSPLFATFVHAFRNAVDHGIEFPAVRAKKNKNEAGRIQVLFDLVEQNRALRIRVQDDGNGIDPAKIRAKLTQKGVDVAGESDQQVIQHIFDSQFSTRDVVTETSGRGVGMDAIRAEAQLLGGKCWAESKLGAGTVLFVEVPYHSELPVKKSAPKAA